MVFIWRYTSGKDQGSLSNPCRNCYSCRRTDQEEEGNLAVGHSLEVDLEAPRNLGSWGRPLAFPGFHSEFGDSYLPRTFDCLDLPVRNSLHSACLIHRRLDAGSQNSVSDDGRVHSLD